MHDIKERDIDRRLLERIHDEYMEMPGLQLTVAQASRLWHVKPESVTPALERLVDSTFLKHHGDCYVRADCGA
jgi:DNA-binding PadR family transcriptional regulator